MCPYRTGRGRGTGTDTGTGTGTGIRNDMSIYLDLSNIDKRGRRRCMDPDGLGMAVMLCAKRAGQCAVGRLC